MLFFTPSRVSAGHPPFNKYERCKAIHQTPVNCKLLNYNFFVWCLDLCTDQLVKGGWRIVSFYNGELLSIMSWWFIICICLFGFVKNVCNIIKESLKVVTSVLYIFKVFANRVVWILFDMCLFVSSQGLIQSLTHSQTKIKMRLLKLIFDDNYGMKFISETNLGYAALPQVSKYTLVADLNKKTCTCGGIAWYEISQAHNLHSIQRFLHLFLTRNCTKICIHWCVHPTRRCSQL